MNSHIEILRKHECVDSTFTDAQPPLVFSRASGSEVYDTEGRRYIDLCAGFGVLALGHNSLPQRQLFEEQLQVQPPVVHGMGDVYPSDSKVEFIQDLVDILPDHIQRAALSLTGAQAVETAIKTALLYKKSGHIISFEGSYHGLDLGVLATTSRIDFKEPFESWIPKERVAELPFGCKKSELLDLAAGLSSGVAAIIVEPVQGRAGIRLAPEGWLAMLRQVADEIGALLIFDEVFTGMGRIGSLSSSSEVAADLICLGKALGGGFPLSACCGTEKAFSNWPKSTGEAIHTGTFFGHPLSCRLGVKVLKEFRETTIITDSVDLGKMAMAYLSSSLESKAKVARVRGQGMMIAIELTEEGLGADLMNILRANGVIALASGPRGESLSLSPALNIKKDLLWEALDQIIASILAL